MVAISRIVSVVDPRRKDAALRLREGNPQGNHGPCEDVTRKREQPPLDALRVFLRVLRAVAIREDFCPEKTERDRQGDLEITGKVIRVAEETVHAFSRLARDDGSEDVGDRRADEDEGEQFSSTPGVHECRGDTEKCHVGKQQQDDVNGLSGGDRDPRRRHESAAQGPKDLSQLMVNSDVYWSHSLEDAFRKRNQLYDTQQHEPGCRRSRKGSRAECDPAARHEREDSQRERNDLQERVPAGHDGAAAPGRLVGGCAVCVQERREGDEGQQQRESDRVQTPAGSGAHGLPKKSDPARRRSPPWHDVQMMPSSGRTGSRGTGRSAALGAALILAGAFLPARLAAQLTTDEVPRGRTVALEAQIKSEVESSRFRLGPLRLIPVFRVSNAGYDSNVFGTPDVCPELTGCDQPKTDDWTATVSGGLRMVVPLGSKIFLRAEALPSYTWYQETEGRRTWGGFYAGSLYMYFNRLSFEARGFQSQALEFLNSETDTRVDRTTDDAALKLEIELGNALSLTGAAEVQQIRSQQVEAPTIPIVNIRQLDRDEAVARAGIRYRFASRWDLTGGVEFTRTEFFLTPELRDNQTVAYMGGIYYDRPRFFANLSGAYREGRAYGGSEYPDFQTATGSYFFSWFPTRRIELQGFGRRGISYGATSAASPYFVETRNGAAINVEAHRRLLLKGFGTYGTNEYPFQEELGEELVERTDTVNTFGGGFSALITKTLVFTGLVYRDTIESLFPGIGRSVLRFSTTFTFEGVFSR